MKNQRLQDMESFIFEKRHTSLQQLCEHFEISINTARRDIEVLRKWGAVDKVYGGVVANPRYRSYLHFGDRSSIHTAEKRRIGELAATFVKSDEIVMADPPFPSFSVISTGTRRRRLSRITSPRTQFSRYYRRYAWSDWAASLSPRQTGLPDPKR